MLSKIYIRFYILLSFFFTEVVTFPTFSLKKRKQNTQKPLTPPKPIKGKIFRKKKMLETSWNFASSEY